MHDATRDALGALLAPLASQIADEVIARLTGGDAGWIDQHSSPLGARKHCAAIRRGELAGHRLGRRWLARRGDVDAYLAALATGAPTPRRSRAAELEEQLSRAPIRDALIAATSGGAR